MATDAHISWENLSKKFYSDSLSVLSINMRSLFNKFAEFLAHLTLLKHKFTLIVITESWLSENRDVGFEIDGYLSQAIYRNGRTGGGIKIYYQKHINIEVIENFSSCSETYESLVLKTKIPGIGVLFLSGIYRIPVGSNFELFLGFISSLMAHLGNHKSIICGDFNLDVISSNLSFNCNDYVQIFSSFGYENLIAGVTYVSPNSQISSSSCIDHIWYNFFSSNNYGYIVTPKMSDHFPTCAIFNAFSENILENVKFRNFSSENKAKLELNADHEFSNLSYDHYDIDCFAKKIRDFLLKLSNKYFPVMTKQISLKRLKSPWMTDIVIRCVRKKYVWFKVLRRNRITGESYRKYCKALRNMLRIVEEDYYCRKFNSLSNNTKKNWQVLNSLLGKSKSITTDNFLINNLTVSNDESIALAFSEYFIDHPQHIQQNIPNSFADFSHLVPLSEMTMGFYYSSDEEFIRAISQLKNNSSLNDIPTLVLKICKRNIATYLSKLFNMCIDQSLFPNIFKISRITPIYKKGSRSLIENYRPIAVLPNLSKLFDKLIYSRVQNFFISRSFFSENQFGFRKNKNTELAIMELVSKILPSLEDRSYCICVFLDYKACFDTISRELLVRKLERYGVRGVGLEFIQAYFENRKQFVSYKSAESSLITQNLGVIQGSQTGPLYFDIYSNEFCRLMGDDQYVLYADDTAIVYSGNNLADLLSFINIKLSLISDWCQYNKLSLNPEKSEFMLITSRNYSSTTPNIVIGNSLIQQVNSTKYLGVNLDSKLKFHSHIESVEIKLCRFSGVSFRLRNHFNKNTALKYYYSCIYSTLSYCLTVWGGVSQCTSRCSKICKLQKKIVKNLFSRHVPRNSNLDIFKEVRILKFPDLYKFGVAIHMFKIIKLGKETQLGISLNMNYPGHSYNTSSAQNIVLPFPRIETIRMNFIYQFINVWNCLPEFIKNSDSLGKFKMKLMQYYLDTY